MSLANPLALVLAGLALPIVALYILKIRLRRVPVSTLIFWRQVFDEKKPRSLFQKLRHLVSLLLQLAFLLLLVFAVADPILRWQQAHSRRIVIVLDDSASMAATDVTPSRLEAARARAIALVEGMRQGDEAAVIAASRPRVVCGPTDHERTLRSAIGSITQVDEPGRIADAVDLAQRLLAGSPKKPRIVILSDGAFDQAEPLAQTQEVDLALVGARTANVGITQLQARRSMLDPSGYEILVEVTNASDTEAQPRLELELDSDPIDVMTLTLKPGEHAVRTFEKTSVEGGWLHAHLSPGDLFTGDDDAWAVLPARARRKVILHTPGNLFLEKVFEAMPEVDLEVVKLAEGAAPCPASVPAGGVVVYHRRVPDRLPVAPVFLIDPERSGPGWTVAARQKNVVVARQDRESPYMANIRLDAVVISEASRLALAGKPRVLAESAAGDPLFAIVERSVSGARYKLAVLAVDLEASDLPLQTAFPIMASNVLSEFGESRGELRESLAAGSLLEFEPPGDLKPGERLILVAPDGREQEIALVPGAPLAAAGPLDLRGGWSVLRRVGSPRGDVAESRRLLPGDTTVLKAACNIADRRETDLRAPEGLATQAAANPLPLAVRPIWYYLIASAWLLSCWEWLLYQRRWID